MSKKKAARIGLFLAIVLGITPLFAGVPATKVHKPTGDKIQVDSGGEVEVQSGGTLDIQSGATVDWEAALNVEGQFQTQGGYMSPQISTAPLTSVTIVMKSTGTLVWNTTDKELCISSGTVQSTFVKVSTPSAACAH